MDWKEMFVLAGLLVNISISVSANYPLLLFRETGNRSRFHGRERLWLVVKDAIEWLTCCGTLKPGG